MYSKETGKHVSANAIYSQPLRVRAYLNGDRRRHDRRARRNRNIRQVLPGSTLLDKHRPPRCGIAPETGEAELKDLGSVGMLYRQRPSLRIPE